MFSCISLYKLSHISLRQDFVACENKLAHKLHLKFIHTIILYKRPTYIKCYIKWFFVCIFLKNFLKNVLYTKVVYSFACNIFWRLNSCGNHVEKYIYKLQHY